MRGDLPDEGQSGKERKEKRDKRERTERGEHIHPGNTILNKIYKLTLSISWRTRISCTYTLTDT